MNFQKLHPPERLELRMKHLILRFITVSILMMFTSVLSSAAQLSLDSTTIVRMEQRDIGTEKQNLIPATQFLGIDVRNLPDNNLSLHLYGWGRADLADNSYNDKKADGSLTYAYLHYRFRNPDAGIRAGRLFVREGIINEQIDGISARAALPLGFGVSAFGGANVHTPNLYGESSDGKGDTIYGGRLNYNLKGLFELGVSGLYESRAPALVNYTNGNHRLVGADIWFAPYKVLDLMGNSIYNTETKSFAGHSYLLNIRPVTRLLLSSEFSEYKEKSFLYSWAMFSGAGLNPDERSRITGVRGSYGVTKDLDLSADYKHYSRLSGTADRAGIKLKLSFLDNSVRSGVSYHYLEAEEGFAITGNSSASYHELRSYLMFDGKNYFGAIDLLGLFFKEKIYNQDSALEATLSLGYHLSPELSISGDVTFGKNPQFSDEVKGLVRINYNAILDNKGGKK